MEKDIKDIISYVRAQEEAKRDDFENIYNEVTHMMRIRRIPLAFYPFILKKAIDDPVLWGAVENLYNQKIVSHQEEIK